VSVSVSVYLSTRSSSIMPLPRPIAQSCLKVITIVVIVIPQVGIPFKTINFPRILGHLQLEVPSKPNKLLVLLYSGLN